MLTTPEFLLAAALGIFLILFGEGLAILFGWMVFSLLTLGQVRWQGPGDQNLKFPWHGLARGTHGRLVLEDQMARLVGILIFLGGVAAYAAWKSGAFA